MKQFEFKPSSGASGFAYSEIHYTKDQIRKLYEISKCNRGIISVNLSIALEDGLWNEIAPSERAVFIVEWLEKIKDVFATEHTHEWIEEFIAQDKL